ncbi:MAG: sigma-54 dependent transcriptional regulator [Deltaproteobacteria bacterium]|nr:sigma-54 dependent transcriptional regulator [Deltaproteobacteria bacterium]
MISYSIYVVDDEESIRDAALMNLTEHQVQAFATAEEAIAAVDREPPDLILQDIGLPGMGGVEAMKVIRSRHPEVLFIMITAFEDVATVVAAMKAGAYDYVVKPLHMDTLKATIANALETIRLRKEVRALQERYLQDNLPCFIAESNQIQSIMGFVRRVAQSPDAPVLIVGETGTGKELIAGAIHYQSPLYRGPLVSLNCAAIPKDLIESELFGYESGAFSGARPGGKKGLIEEAKDGTLFLDEVGDLPAEAQAKLLRFLDSGEFYKVGGTKPRSAKVRVVSATNRDLEAMTASGDFRRDLYYRLGMIKVELPALNRRREDILPIAQHFLVELNQKYGKGFQGFTPAAAQLLAQRNYQGNVRELKGLLERAVLTGQEPRLSPQDLGLGLDQGGSHGGEPALPEGASLLPPLDENGLDLAQILADTERHYLAQALEMTEDNDAKAAQLLSMNYHTFRYRKKKLLDG